MQELPTIPTWILQFLTGGFGTYTYFYCVMHDGFGIPKDELEELLTFSALHNPKVRYTFIVIGGGLSATIDGGNLPLIFLPLCFVLGFLLRQVFLYMFKIKLDIMKILFEHILGKK